MLPYQKSTSTYRKATACLAAVCISMTGFVIPAVAVSEDSQKSSRRVIEEILVVARKREESAMDVPISLHVVSGADIEAANQRSLVDVAKDVPGLYMSFYSANFVPRAAIRGFGTVAVLPSVDQAVGVSVDGLFLPRQQAWNAALFDVNRVEVLRGPQGTYFGKNTTAGLLNVVSNGPTDSWELQGRVGYEFEADEQLYEAIVSGPLSDSLGMRLGVQKRESDGWFHNTNHNVRVPARDDLTARLTIEYQPSNTVNISSKTTYYEARVEGSLIQNAICPASLIGFMSFVIPDNVDDCRLDNKGTSPSMFSSPPDTFNIVSDSTLNRLLGSDLSGASQSIVVDWDIGEYTLTSVTGYQEFENPLVSVGAVIAHPIFMVPVDQEFDGFSQEIRLQTPVDRRVSAVLGFYYDDVSYTYDQLVHFAFSQLDPTLPHATALKNATGDSTSKAGFAEVTANINDQLRVILGARYTQVDIGFDAQQYLGDRASAFNSDSFPAFFLTLATPYTGFDFDLKEDESQLTPAATVQWDFNKNGQAYLSYREGFKNGGFDFGITNAIAGDPTTPTRDIFFDSEFVKSYEIGGKMGFPEHGIQLSIAAFLMEFDDLQVSSFIGGNTFTPVVVNAADADSKGIEIAAMWQITENFRANLNLAHIKAEYGTFNNSPCYEIQTAAEGCIENAQDVSGAELTLNPENKLSVGFDWRVGVFNDFEVVIGGNYTYQDEVQTNVNQDPRAIADSIQLANVRVALNAPEDNWSLIFYGNNLLDEQILQTAQPISAFFGGMAGSISEPRTYGIQFVLSH